MKKHLTILIAWLATAGVLIGLVVGSATARSDDLTASLSGGGEGEDPNGAGSGTFSLDPATGMVCFDLTWTKIRGPFAAHIHEGAEGQSGDIAVHLFDMKGGTPLAGTIKGVSGCRKKVDDAVIDAILADPGGYYVNVHNRRFPAGAIRGQLGSSTPTTSSTSTSTMTSTVTSTPTSTGTPPYP